jgi:hypothetical protein
VTVSLLDKQPSATMQHAYAQMEAELEEDRVLPLEEEVVR